MNKQELYAYLKEKGVAFEAVEHPPVFTVEEADALQLPNPEVGAKNLFLRDSKKSRYYLLTMRDHQQVRIREFQHAIGAKPLSFASEEDLMKIMGLIKGSVTPFGALNDEARIVTVYFDDFYRGNMISVHPNENTATIYLQADDLISLLREHGNEVHFISLEGLSGEE